MQNDGSSTTLKVRWKAPEGKLDSYNVSLTEQGSIKHSRTLNAASTEVIFNELTPGRLYQVNVTCIAGELSTDKMAVGRTGEYSFPCVPFLLWAMCDNLYIFYLSRM